MAEKQPMTEAMYYVLLALTRPDHGYGLMGHIREISRGRVVMGPGTLYGILTRLRREGMILLRDETGRKKTYEITAYGMEALTAEYRRLKNMVRDGEILEDEAE